MDRATLRAAQAPLRERCTADPATASVACAGVRFRSVATTMDLELGDVRILAASSSLPVLPTIVVRGRAVDA